MGQFQQHLRVEQISNELYIDVAIDRVYDYVTRPDRWHEWRPSSLRADTGLSGSLPSGHRFTEVIDLLGLQIRLNYRVLIAGPPHEFKTIFSSAPADGSIHYQLHKCGYGTWFRHTLHYSTDLNLGSLRPRIAALSDIALNNLKRTLESRAG